MLVKKEVIFPLCAIFIAIATQGCQTIDSQIMTTHNDCATFGFPPGSEAFKRCVARGLAPQDFHEERSDLTRQQEQLELQKEKLAYKKEKLKLRKADLTEQKRQLEDQRISQTSRPSTVVIMPPSLDPAPYGSSKQSRSQTSRPRNSWEESHDAWVQRKKDDIQVLRTDEIEADVERRRSEQKLLERSARERRSFERESERSSRNYYQSKD